MVNYYLLGGRSFRSAATQTTFAQDGYLMGVVRANKLDTAINRDEDMLAAIFTAGCASALLSALLVEDGKTWSRETALANVTHFDGLTADDEKALLVAALERLLIRFFPAGGSSSKASPTSSREGAPRRRPRRRTVAMPAITAESGPDSSPTSPSTPASG